MPNFPTFSIIMTFTSYLSSIRMGMNTPIPMTECGEKLGLSKADATESIPTGISGTNASGNPCSDIYRGRRPFSEPELKALRDYILPQKDNFILYLAFHSYGQYILYPWGYDKVDAKNVKELHKLGEYGANAARFKYSVGNSAKLLYPAAGNFSCQITLFEIFIFCPKI